MRVRKADFLGRLGQYPRALTILRDEIASAERRLAQGTIAVVEYGNFFSHIGWVEAEMGDHDAARDHLEVALAGVRPAETPPDLAGLLVNGAYCALLAGNEAELRLGLDLAERAIRLIHRGATWLIKLAIAHRIAAELYPALDNPAAAQANSEEALRDLGIGRYEAELFFFTHARSLLANGRQTEAENFARQAYERVFLVAEQTDDVDLRRSWLGDVRCNRAIIAQRERLNQAA